VVGARGREDQRYQPEVAVIHLKDIETVQGDPTRLRRWVEMVRSELAE
jgi:hypothetical protein